MQKFKNESHNHKQIHAYTFCAFYVKCCAFWGVWKCFASVTLEFLGDKDGDGGLCILSTGMQEFFVDKDGDDDGGDEESMNTEVRGGSYRMAKELSDEEESGDEHASFQSEHPLLADIQSTGLLENIVRKKPGQTFSYFVRKIQIEEMSIEEKIVLNKGLNEFGKTIDEYSANASNESIDVALY